MPPAAQSTTYEFRGVYQLEDVYYFNIYDPKEMKGVWLTSADPDQGSIEIIDFDSEGDELIVRIDGETQNLALVKTSDTPMPVARATGPRQQIRPTSGPAQGPADRRRVIRPLERQTSTDSPEAPRRRVIRPNPQS